MRILILPPKNPDLDGVACALAYSELRKLPWSYYGTPQLEPRILIDRYGIAVDPLTPADAYILVDNSELPGTPPFVDPKKVIEIIDHRPSPDVEKNFPNAKIQIEKVGAAATLIGEKFIEEEVEPSTLAATFLRAAIYSNTLAFRASIATERDRKVYEFLGKFAEPIEGWLMEKRNEAYLKNLEEQLTLDFRYYPDASLGISQLEVFGAEPFLERIEEILGTLRSMAKIHGLRHVFLNMPDIATGTSYFIIKDKRIKEVLERDFGAEFDGPVGKRKGLLLRKQVKEVVKKGLKG